MQKKEIETFCPTSPQDWRHWLQAHHDKKQSIWLIYYKKKVNLPTITWREAVDEALCYGWIDGIKKSIDHERFMQFFSKRKTGSTWSKINKEKVVQLIEQGRMTKPGLDSIETAKQNGSWVMLDDVEALKIPKDLEEEFKAKPGSKDFFLSLSKSVRKAMLQGLVFAKRKETRKKRIEEIVALAGSDL